MGDLEVPATGTSAADDGLPATAAGPDPGRDPRGPGARRPGPSLRPALVVVAVAALILALFGIGAVLTGGGTRHAAAFRPVPRGPARVPGTPLLARPAAAALAPIRQAGTPPPDVVQTLALPTGARRVADSPSRSVTLFNASERFAIGATQASVIDFYKAELRAMKWRVTSTGPARNQPQSIEVLAQRAGSDGWYWEVGVVVAPTAFSGAAAGAATGAVTGTTPFTLRLFQVNDAT